MSETSDPQGKRSCASCPEMDNPDSYISHLNAALRWYDEQVLRPMNPNATCVVLQGKKPPEEVLFVRDEGGVTHYLPEVTKGFKWHLMSEETPEKGRKNYIIMGTKGGIYLAPMVCGYHDETWFKDSRGRHHYPKEVKAWAEIPPLEVNE